MEFIVEAIKTLGFPVACVVFLAVYVKQITDQYREDIKTLTEKYDSTVATLQEKYEKAIDKFVKSNDRITAILSALEAKFEKKGEPEE